MKTILLASALTVSSVAAAATIGLLASAQPLAAEPVNFGQGTQIGRVGTLPALPPELRGLYSQFRREARYFAAFAVHFEKAEGFYIQNFHDAASVRAAALEGCKQYAQAEGCVIYAVAMPESLPVDHSRATGLSEWAADDFTTVYKEKQKPGTYGAFAVSGASHHGYAHGYKTAAEAANTAIAYCKIGVVKDMAELGPEARKYARARGWQNCKVIESRFTPENQS
ncbi:hypothetical protein [uncultured Sulfitobacter sp.]|uniref:hypothetical protein n=1 Tax=uncultured Sulfitobacter sp. TaxID=191468 RepID=UPI002617A057|nr:hypothetical protein [uncultured Sulfitobacter sp.]